MTLEDRSGIYLFGDFEVDLAKKELRRKGIRIPLQAKPFRFLVVLLRSAGKVVSRDVIARRLWPDTHVEVDQGLNAAARKVRIALDDDAQDPVYVETVGRMGYRFKHSVRVVSDRALPGGSSDEATL